MHMCAKSRRHRCRREFSWRIRDEFLRVLRLFARDESGKLHGKYEIRSKSCRLILQDLTERGPCSDHGGGMVYSECRPARGSFTSIAATCARTGLVRPDLLTEILRKIIRERARGGASAAGA